MTTVTRTADGPGTDHLAEDEAALANDDVQPTALLTFALGGETFAINVIRVQEILDVAPYTRVPNADPFSPGVINVRGNVVPVVDLRYRFGLPPLARGETARTVVFDIELAGEPTRVAAAVDAVWNVEPMGDLLIEEIPEIGTRWNRDFVHGITRIRDQLTIILDLAAVFLEVNTDADCAR